MLAGTNCMAGRAMMLVRLTVDAELLVTYILTVDMSYLTGKSHVTHASITA